MEHKKLIHYVTMMVERVEMGTESDQRQLPQPKVKAKAKSMPAHTVPINIRGCKPKLESMPTYMPEIANTENIHALQQE